MAFNELFILLKYLLIESGTMFLSSIIGKVPTGSKPISVNCLMFGNRVEAYKISGPEKG